MHPEHIEEMSGSEADIELPEYSMIKISLMRLVDTKNPIRFAYLMAERNGNLVFLMDSESPESPDYSPPGQVYTEAKDIDREPFRTGEPVLKKPTNDRWGTWVSALVPVKNPESGETIAVFGIDYSASEWYAALWKQMIPDITVVVVFLLLYLAFLYILIQHSRLNSLNKKLAFDEALCHGVFDQSPIGIAIVNDKNFIYESNFGHASINPMFEKIIGRKSYDLSNIKWTEITHPEDLQADLDKFDQFKKGEINGYIMEKRFIKPDGSSVWTNMTVSPLTGLKEATHLHLCMLEDISIRKEKEKGLIESERSKSLLLSHLPGMTYRCKYDREWTMQFVSDGCYGLTGYTPEDLINNKSSYNDIIASEYRSFIWEKWTRVIENRLPFKQEYEIITAAGERKWVLEMGEGVYDEHGEIEALEGLILDISDRKEAEKQLKQSFERTQSMINNHEAVMLLVEPLSGKIIEANSAASNFYGYSKEELLNMAIQDINTLDKDEVAALRMKALNKGQKYFTFPHRLKNGEIKVVDVYSSPIDYDDNKVLFSIIFDVTEREKKAKENEHLSYHDYLTGLYNRRFFEEEFERRVKTGEFPIAILLGDIDGFKIINDTFGRAEGDRIIRELSTQISKLVENKGILARIGGDEFAIITSQKTEHEIRQYLNIIEQVSCSVQTALPEKEIVTVSWGYGIQRNEDDTIDVLNEEAETFMYNRKFYSNRSARSKTLNVIMETLFAKSAREEKHSKRVGKLCESIAIKMHLSQGEIDKIRVAGTLHDIGKIGIEEAILNKPGKLDNREWEIMKLHPAKGAAILQNTIEYSDISDIVLSHHERYDGFGYPNGVKAEAIPLGARIIAIADTYDAITNVRPYKEAMSEEQAINEIKKCSGSQLDPDIVSVFINAVIGGK